MALARARPREKQESIVRACWYTIATISKNRLIENSDRETVAHGGSLAARCRSNAEQAVPGAAFWLKRLLLE